MLTPEQEAYRELGCSDLPYLMHGTSEEINNRYKRIVGDPSYVPPDFTENWPVIMGNLVETPALDWEQRRGGYPLVRRQEWVVHPEFPYLGCHLDAYREHDKCVIDVKWAGAYRKLDDVLKQYTAQLVGQRGCTNADNASLLVVHGGQEPREFAICWEREYEKEVWERVKWFWNCVETLQPPCEIPKAKAPVIATKSIDMSQSNRWCALADVWLTTGETAKRWLNTVKEIKELVPEDAVRAHGHGIIASRNRAGALTINVSKERVS